MDGRGVDGAGLAGGRGIRHGDRVRPVRFRALGRDLLLSPGARTRAYFRPGAIQQLFDRQAEDPTPYHGDILWNVLMLELWHRRHVDGAAGS